MIFSPQIREKVLSEIGLDEQYLLHSEFIEILLTLKKSRVLAIQNKMSKAQLCLFSFHFLKLQHKIINQKISKALYSEKKTSS